MCFINFLHFRHNAPGCPDRFHHLLQNVAGGCGEKVLLSFGRTNHFSGNRISLQKFFRVSDYLIVCYDSDHRLYYFFIFFKFSNHTKINYKKAYYSSNFQRVKLLGPIFFLKYIKQKSKRVFSTIYYFLREFFLEHHRSGGGDLFEFEYL